MKGSWSSSGGLTIADATVVAGIVMREMGRKTYSDRELMILARELKRHHDAGRLSMYRTIAGKLDMVVKADLEGAKN